MSKTVCPACFHLLLKAARTVSAMKMCRIFKSSEFTPEISSTQNEKNAILRRMHDH